MKYRNIMKSILLLTLLFGAMSTARAEDRFYIDAVNIEPGETKTLAFNLDNTKEFYGFQTDISLPEGVAIVMNGSKPDIILSSRFDTSYTLVSNLLSSGKVRLGTFSSSHTPISGNSGALLYLKISAADNFVGGTISLTDILFIDANDRDVQLPEFSIDLGTVHNNSFYIPDFSIDLDETKTVSIILDNETPFSAFQTDIYLPKGLTIENNSFVLSSRALGTHSISAKNFSDGRTRIACFSTGNDVFTGNSGDLLSFNITADKDVAKTCQIELKNQIFSMANAKEYMVPNSITNVTTGRVLVESVTLNKNSLSLVVGDSELLTATVLPSFATTKDVDWSSESPEIATVSTNGLVTAVGLGTTTIKVEAVDGSDKFDECTVTVSGIPVTGITLNQSTASLKETETIMLTATVSPANATDKSLTWESLNPEFATVDADTGLVTAQKVGEATIIAKSVSNPEVTAQCTITISPLPISEITLNQNTVSIGVGESFEFTYNVLPESATNKDVIWSIDPQDIASVSSDGKVTGLSFGTSYLTVTAADGFGAKAVATVTVIPTISTDISINVTTPGTLSSLINESNKNQVKSLTVTGFLNGTDIRYIREMAGSDVNGSKTDGVLEILDISGATIVSGGDYYYTKNPSSSSSSDRMTTSNNQISDYMFYGCSTLTDLSLPLNSTTIGSYAFDGCINLSDINLADGITAIGEFAFNGDIALTSMAIPEHTTTIGNYAFQGCSGLTSFNLSSTVETIGIGILKGCSNVREISLNNDNPYFSTLNGVLYNNTGTNLIIYPAGKELQIFEIPDGVTEIMNLGFYGTTALEYLFLPESLTTIGEDSFKGCSSLTKLFARPANPAVCANDCFETIIKSNCILYVPKGSGNDYRSAPVWCDILKTVESNDLTLEGNIDKPDYGFEFPERTLSRGKYTYLPVAMNNVDPVVAFNCDIVFPDGVKPYENASGEIEFKTSERFPKSQIIDSRIQANGDLRIISTSTSNEAFNGTDGILFYIPLMLTDPDVSQDSEYQLTFKNIEFTRKDLSGYHAVESPDITVTLTVSEYTLGDANGDGRITGVDAVIAKGYFLGDNPTNFIFKAADMNFDGKISSTDVVLITDVFLAQNQSMMVKTTTYYDTQGNIDITGTNNSAAAVSFDINLPGAYRFTALQMDMTVAEGLYIKNIRVCDGNRTSHNVKYYSHANGMTRLFISSDYNEDFCSENLLTIELEGDGCLNGSEEITLDNVFAVEISGHNYLETALEGRTVTLSDVSRVSSPNPDSQIDIWSHNSTLYIKSASDGFVNICDVAGRLRLIHIDAGINSIPLNQGIYLINNNKIIIK